MTRMTFNQVSILIVLGAGLLVGANPGAAQQVNLTGEPVRTVFGAEQSDPVTPTLFIGDVRDLPSPRAWQPGDPIREIPKGRPGEDLESKDGPTPAVPHIDPLLELQRQAPSPRAQRDFQTPILNFAGGGFSSVNPPDTVGAVGLAHYIQGINGSGGTQIRIYDKETGTLSANFVLDSLGENQCANGLGDPIILFDTLADRWLLSEFSSSGNRMCVYISQTSDPISGGWYAYNFQAPSFPDYPKYAVWPDAYYVGTNEATLGLYAFDRTKMLTGQAATFIRLSTSKLSGFGFQALQPADLDGRLPPPAGSPGIFARHRDTEVHGPSGFPSNDFVELFEMSVDFDTPANSSITGPIQIPVAEFDSTLCGLTSFQCFPQPNGVQLDPLREVIMWRLAYRNFGTHEAMVGTFVTDVAVNQGGKRWFELRRDGGKTGSWELYQEGTYAPDTLNRFMGSIAQDRIGNIALGYGANNSTNHPSIRYIGRLTSDPLGTMPYAEQIIAQGNASNSSNRWGDYSSMNVDPVDDCTFWYTHQYNPSGGQWETRIANFAFDACFSEGFGLSVDPTAQAICAPGALAPITVNVNGFNDYDLPITLSLLDPPTGLSGIFVPNPVMPGTSSTGNFSLDATAVAGDYLFQLLAVGADDQEQSVNLNLSVATEAPDAVNLTSPADGQQGVSSSSTSFSWEAISDTLDYTLEIAENASFDDVVFSVTTASTTATVIAGLSVDTEYFWRITAGNACGAGASSEVFSFRTSLELCSTPNIAIPDNNPAGISDSLLVSGAAANLDRLRVALDISHTWVGDLIITLTHAESGITRALVNRPGVIDTGFGCSGNDIDLFLDDEATLSIQNDCTGGPNPQQAFIAGESYTPAQSLDVFDGVTLDGNWTINVSDRAGGDIGTLHGWCLLPETAEPLPDLIFSDRFE